MKAALQNLKRFDRANISPEAYQLIQQLRERNPAQQPIQQTATVGKRLIVEVLQLLRAQQQSLELLVLLQSQQAQMARLEQKLDALIQQNT